MKKIFVINGSAGNNSANQKLIDQFAVLTKSFFELTIFNELKSLPHFDPQLTLEHTPPPITAFRQAVENADAVLICTPEYIFSIPSGLKNALEWCVATILFSEKPVGLITASAQGEKGHIELQLLMQTLGARFTPGTTLLIQGIKGKIDAAGFIKDEKTNHELSEFIKAFQHLLNEGGH